MHVLMHACTVNLIVCIHWPMECSFSFMSIWRYRNYFILCTVRRLVTNISLFVLVMKKQPISPSGKKMALFSLLVSILMLYWRRTPLRCCGGGGVQLISPLVRFRVTAFRSPGGADGISSRVCTCRLHIFEYGESKESHRKCRLWVFLLYLHSLTGGWLFRITSHFLFIKNKRLFISSEGFSTLEKSPGMLSDGNAAHPVRFDSPLLIVMSVWRPFCLNSNFLGRVWQPSADNNGAPKGHYYLQRAGTPDQITQQNSLQMAGAP